MQTWFFCAYYRSFFVWYRYSVSGVKIAINSTLTPIPVIITGRVAVPFISPLTVAAAMLIGFRSMRMPVHFGIVDESTRMLLANSSGYSNHAGPRNRLRPFGHDADQRKIQLTLNAKNRMKAMASTIWMTLPSGRKPRATITPTV